MVWECVCVRTHACIAILMWRNVAAKIWLLQFLKILCMCGRASVLVQMFVVLSVCRSQAAGVHAVWWAGPASCLGRNLPPIWPDHSQQHSVLDRLEQVSRSLCPEYIYYLQYSQVHSDCCQNRLHVLFYSFSHHYPMQIFGSSIASYLLVRLTFHPHWGRMPSVRSNTPMAVCRVKQSFCILFSFPHHTHTPLRSFVLLYW